jgi:protoheme IX farnesyltransferase
LDYVQPELSNDVTMSEMIKKYILVTKPGIIFGNLITTAGGFFLASKGHVDNTILFSTLIGVSLVVASGCVFNNCIDRNIDRKMIRTKNRVLAKGSMSLKAAIFYATLLSISGTVLLWTSTNRLCVAIVLTGFTIYVAIYSLYLKRNSIYGALVGCLAGAAPPLAGYCAVTERFDMGALILLSIFTLWQMPHCYAIAVYRIKDYATAGIPILPVKQGIPAAKRHITGYILAFSAATMMLTFAGYTGYSFFAVTMVMSLVWLGMAWSGFKISHDRTWAKKMMVFSILTVTVLSFMMATDFTSSSPAGMLLTCVP